MQEKSMYTRKQYLNKECTHREYYEQFVNGSVEQIVRVSIGLDRILHSTDPYLNDIPLKRWDMLEYAILQAAGHKFCEVNQCKGMSLSDCVCIAKAAARKMIRAGERGELKHLRFSP
jgi:transcription termination factor NusB